MAKINHHTVPNSIHHWFSLAIMVLGLAVVCCGCKKDKATKAVLPPKNQEGKNTVGFTLNGEVWLPYYKCAIGSDPCGELSARYSYPYAAPYGIGFQFARLKNGKSSSLTIYTEQQNTICTIGNKIDSIGVVYSGENSEGNNDHYAYPQPGSKFLVSKIDHQRQIISGEFVFILREQNGSGKEITLNDGRFDFKFNTCKCSSE